MEKTLILGKIEGSEGYRAAADEMCRQHHGLNEHGIENLKLWQLVKYIGLQKGATT